MIRVRRDMLCVTQGTLEELPGQRFAINAPKMRAFVNQWTLQTVAAHITYLGPTCEEAKLASGEARRQFGFKLHAQDACNVVYAMWRIEPEPKLVVSLKSNPGQHPSADCGNRAYRNIKPFRDYPVLLLRPGDSHWLRAEMHGTRLRVCVDDAVVWDGQVGKEIVEVSGPLGIRSDNARLEFELQADHSPGPQPHYVVGCKSATEPD
jgi:hypothetical protein